MDIGIINTVISNSNYINTTPRSKFVFYASSSSKKLKSANNSSTVLKWKEGISSILESGWRPPPTNGAFT